MNQVIIPKVSIGMPVFNGARFIAEALDSICVQTFTDFELIISDNASTDSTEAICREYAARDRRIRYVKQTKNLGPIANFKFLMNEAVGEYFMWASVDDRRDKDYIKFSLMILEDDKDCGLVFCDYSVLNLESGCRKNVFVGMFNAGNPGKRYLMRLFAPCPSMIYGLHRLSFLKRIPPQNYDYFDVHLTHWYALHSRVKVLPLPMYVAGISGKLTADGDRIPYSLTGKKIDASLFLKEERKMLFEELPFFTALTCYCALRYFYFRNIRRSNKTIEIAKRNR